MKAYRVYSVEDGGRISGDRMIEAENDEEAVFAVRSMQRQFYTEVWHRDRRVAKVPPHRSGNQASSY